ncbi:hypothetical protein BP6252_07316 [Coleophoma cylindrospora]|uniref:BZIP domain-containing protein n=1 Tax=Coleophoma cylindrospora TaxID=1849047 RepID=A0A3D8RH85_9HELO|nr:hypothetical protein BP6252_07316 [Coleophoma cylindrospora]
MLSGHHTSSQIRLGSMPGLAEAVDEEDDWTGVTDPTSRRKRQTRLNVRAYRRRKALELTSTSKPAGKPVPNNAKVDPDIPCWIEDQQRVSILPASQANRLIPNGAPLIPLESLPHLTKSNKSPATIIFPLSRDHLIVLLQFNVLRASIANRSLLSGIPNIPLSQCSSSALHISAELPSPHLIPATLHPTLLQRTVPHEDWIDIIPHPVLRDNILLAVGTFDEDALWSDVIGGLFEGFPGSEIEQRGVIAWSPPWHVSGWEVSEGFLRRWGWSLKGCEDMLDATNKWRSMRGEEPLAYDFPE